MDLNCFGELASLTNSIVLCWRGKDRRLFQQHVTGTFGHVQPAHGQVGVGINLQRVLPRFPHELWNVGLNEATVNGAPPTNNQCEGWNNRCVLPLVGYKHPSIWTLIETIQMENREVVTLIAQDLIGEPRWHL